MELLIPLENWYHHELAAVRTGVTYAESFLETPSIDWCRKLHLEANGFVVELLKNHCSLTVQVHQSVIVA